MAITFVNRGTEVTGSTSVAPGYPASLAAGDLILLCVNHKAGGSVPSAPTGFSLVRGATGSTGQTTVVFGKTSTGSESGTVTVSGLTSSSTGVMVAYRGVSIPADLTTLARGSDDGTRGATLTPQLDDFPADTYATDEWKVWVTGSLDDSWPMTSPATSTVSGSGVVGSPNRRTTDALETATGTDNALAVTDAVVTTGAAATIFRFSFTQNTSAQIQYIVLALTPAGAATASNPPPLRLVTQQARIRSNLY